MSEQTKVDELVRALNSLDGSLIDASESECAYLGPKYEQLRAELRRELARLGGGES